MFTWFIQTHAQINEKFVEWVRLTYGKTE